MINEKLQMFVLCLKLNVTEMAKNSHKLHAILLI